MLSEILTPMTEFHPTNSEIMQGTSLYKELLAEREEILRHKWIESEKAGHDIGFDRALLDWVMKYRSQWRELRHPR
jgi:hypothetical protein